MKSYKLLSVKKLANIDKLGDGLQLFDPITMIITIFLLLYMNDK